MERSQLEKDADSLPTQISERSLKEIAREKVPVVLAFQPTGYFEVPAERLQEWEELLKERIGLPPSAEFNLPNNALRCVTCSPCADDCGHAQ